MDGSVLVQEEEEHRENNLDEEERDIIIAMKDKTISELYPSITYELVKEAYPKIL